MAREAPRTQLATSLDVRVTRRVALPQPLGASRGGLAAGPSAAGLAADGAAAALFRAQRGPLGACASSLEASSPIAGKGRAGRRRTNGAVAMAAPRATPRGAASVAPSRLASRAAAAWAGLRAASRATLRPSPRAAPWGSMRHAALATPRATRSATFSRKSRARLVAAGPSSGRRLLARASALGALRARRCPGGGFPRRCGPPARGSLRFGATRWRTGRPQPLALPPATRRPCGAGCDARGDGIRVRQRGAAACQRGACQSGAPSCCAPATWPAAREATRCWRRRRLAELEPG